MKKPKQLILLNFLVIFVILLIYYLFIAKRLRSSVTLPSIPSKTSFHSPEHFADHNYDVWLIFTKVTNRSLLTTKFGNLLYNLLNVSSVPLKFHIIVDEKSKIIAKYKLSEVVYKSNKTLAYRFYNVQESASKINDIVTVMTPFFSSKPGTYYSDALFYISLGLYRIAPTSQKRAILLDCDLFFKRDIALLFDEFSRFKPPALFGLAPELTPVYHHILHMYRLKHKTTFGDFYHDKPISPYETHPQGFQGYNSGVVLINLEKLRHSHEYSKIISKESVRNMTEKYKFRGHLGDQDFYTLVGFQYPHLIQTINCGFNRQLCTWWRDHGYKEIFDYFFKCKHPTVILHGNCNTKIPKD